MTDDSHSPHDHDGGLARDLPRLMGRRGVLISLAMLGAGSVLASRVLGGPPSNAEANLTATGANGTCLKDPGETNGPYPADGTNTKGGQTVNALTQSGVVRDDLRPSFGDLSGMAEGVPLTVEITLVDVGTACQPLAGHAIYLWHADAEGHYSLYDLPDQNFLRGVILTDAAGKARVTTILPGCYDGRWPHIHFEVFTSLEAATDGHAALLTSQFALPQAPCAAVYAADPRYAGSAANLGHVTLTSDNVFGDNTPEQVALQTLALTGDPTQGFAATVQVGVVAKS